MAESKFIIILAYLVVDYINIWYAMRASENKFVISNILYRSLIVLHLFLFFYCIVIQFLSIYNVFLKKVQLIHFCTNNV